MAEEGGLQITVRGATQLASTLRAAGQNLQRMDSANLRAGQAVVSRAKVLCPVKTGRLQGSIRVANSRGGFEVVASENLPYGRVQHWGWPAHHIRATLFLTRGLEQAQPEVLQIYQAEVANVMQGVRGA
jgi:hypothetical protein